MSTQEVATMTTKDVANRFSELAQKGAFDKIQDELFSEDAVSIEPDSVAAMGSPVVVKGLAGIKEKAKKFNEMVEEIHGGWTSQPVVGGDYFSVAMGMDVTMKGMGRMNMDEVCVYRVQDGMIVSEQFFFTPGKM